MDKPHKVYVDYKKPDIKEYAMIIPFAWCLRTCKANPRWQKSEGWVPMGCVTYEKFLRTSKCSTFWQGYELHRPMLLKNPFKCPLTNIHWTLQILSRYMNLITSPFFPQSGVSMHLVTLPVSEEIKSDTNNTAFSFENCLFFTCFNIIRFPFWWEYDHHIICLFHQHRLLSLYSLDFCFNLKSSPGIDAAPLLMYLVSLL